jgi:hypothetical protein
MYKKILIGLAPLLAAAAMGVGASSAAAAACTANVLCNNTNEALRDDAVEPKGYGMDGLAVNTAGPLRFCATFVIKTCNENATGYAFFGLKLDKDPAAENGKEATGWVEFADVQHATPSAVFSGTAPEPAGFGPWPIKVRSDKSTENPGKVTIEKAHLLFPTLGPGGTAVTAIGTFTGKWVQPGECAGGSGGVKLDIAQPGITVTTATKPELDNGKGEAAFICFVSANNYLFPEKAPAWTPLTGNIWKD